MIIGVAGRRSGLGFAVPSAMLAGMAHLGVFMFARAHAAALRVGDAAAEA
jgi:hypothetical protein